MIEIIGWMGCLYFVIKGIEITSSSVFRGEDGSPRRGVTAASMLCWGGAVIFGIWLSAQVSTIKEAQASSDLKNSIKETCIQLAKTPDAMLECMR